MTLHDLYLLSPEMSMAGLAGLLLVLDMVFGRRVMLSTVSLVGLALPLGLSIALWLDLDRQGAQQMTGVFGTLSVDKFSLFFKFLFIGAAAIVVLSSAEYAKRLESFQPEYYALILLSTTGMMLLASTLELITLYISLELTALPVAALAAFLRDSRSSESGLKFLLLSAISSAVLLYGMVWVYGLTGTTMLGDVAERLGSMDLGADRPFGSYALLLGVVLLIAGFGFKITSVPFQMWAPDVYEGSPTPVTAFLSVASKAAGFAVILRVFFLAFSTEVVSSEWGIIFAVLSALSMTLGNFVAIPQSNIKRMLAYSTVAQAGYMMVGLAAVAGSVSETGELREPSSLLFYLAGYAVTNLAAFAVVIAISNRIGSDRIEDYAGAVRRTPYLAAALAVAMISLTGLPPTVGFMAKLYVFGAAVQSGLAWLVVLGVVNSVISAYYYLRVVRVMYLSPPPTPEPIPVDLPLRVAIISVFAAVLFFGVYPAPLIRLAASAASVLVS